MLIITSCNTYHQQSYMTRHLFMRSDRVSISHYGVSASNSSRENIPRVLGEQLTYTESEVNEKDVSGRAWQESGAERLDTNKVYSIPQVTVVSRAKFAPVREGKVEIDFVIRVPKGLLSDDYQLCLTPELLHGDSLVLFEDVILRGKNFINQQEKDYERYNEYISTIVTPEGYDTAFIDRKAVEMELNRRRKSELDNYYKRWNLYQQYHSWRGKKQEEYDLYNVRERNKFNERLHEFEKEYNARLLRVLATHQDTAAFFKKYRKKKEKLLSSTPVYRQITMGTVPARFRDIYLSGVTVRQFEPLLPLQEDSLRIASEHRMNELIAFNEMKDIRKEEVFKRMVPVPYRSDVRKSAIINPEWDFVYRYTQSYPVTPGLRKLRLTLSGYITATDRSHYNIRNVDTLSFVISSMNELADGSLISNQNFSDGQRQEYAHALQLLRNREYQRALNILNHYKDYNTALTLTCMGYNKQAYELLTQLEKNAASYYLAAILSCRLGEENQAIKYLKEAYRLDNSKSLREGRDPEISTLIRKYGIQQELEEILVTGY